MGIRELFEQTKSLCSGIHDYRLNNVHVSSDKEIELLNEAHKSVGKAFECIAKITKIKSGKATA